MKIKTATFMLVSADELHSCEIEHDKTVETRSDAVRVMIAREANAGGELVVPKDIQDAVEDVCDGVDDLLMAIDKHERYGRRSDGRFAFDTVGVGCSSMTRELDIAGMLIGDVVVVVKEADWLRVLGLAEAYERLIAESENGTMERLSA